VKKFRILGVRAVASAVAGSALLLSAVVPPAHAETRAVRDEVGDTNAANDVTRVKINNGSRRVRVVAKYRDLGPGHLSSGVTIDTGVKGRWAYYLGRHQDFDGSWVVRLVRFHQDEPGRSRRVSCPAKGVGYFPGDESKIVFTLPQRCFGKHKGDAWFQVSGAQSEGSAPPPEYAPRKPVFVARG